MHYLSGKEKKQLNPKLPKGYNIDKKDNIYLKDSVLYKDDKPLFIIISEEYVPHLKSIPEGVFKSVYIDHGAVPFLMKGADMMRPGVSEIEEGFESGETILIKDEVHKKTLGVGCALFNSKDMKVKEGGKVVKVLHHMKDEFFGR